MWAAVDALLDRAPDEVALRHHGLHLLAASRWAAAGLPVPAGLQLERRAMAARELALPLVLGAVREACDGRLLLMKGPEAARWWPGRATRAYQDLDLLTDDAPRAHATLRRAGWEETGDPAIYAGIHHLRPLRREDHPFAIELHTRPKWPDGLTGPSGAELLDAGEPASVPVEGLLAPAPAEHAVLLAAHAWAHRPLGRLAPLVDVAAASRATDRRALADVAGRWGCTRLWVTTLRACDALVGDGPRPAPLRTWARHLEGARDWTVRADHLQRWLASWWALPPGAALAAGAAAVATDLRPGRDEPWEAKLRRTRAALDDAALAKSEHDRRIGPRPGRDPLTSMEAGR